MKGKIMDMSRLADDIAVIADSKRKCGSDVGNDKHNEAAEWKEHKQSKTKVILYLIMVLNLLS